MKLLRSFTSRAIIAALVERLGGDVTLTFEEIENAPNTMQDGLTDALRFVVLKPTAATGPNLAVETKINGKGDA